MKKFLFPVATAIVLACGVSLAAAAPAQIILIRHGEKPAHGNQLDEQGFARARALVGYFKANPAVTAYGTPVAIYAMKPKGPNGSVRPIQTVTPLAEALNLPVISDFLKDDATGLVTAILGNKAYDGKMVLICWEHNAIPDIVSALASAAGTADGVQDALPGSWDGDAFDRTWILDFSPDGKIVSFRDLPQRLLPGDSAE